jgi:hypothetical protein
MALVVAASDVAELADGLPKDVLAVLSPALRAEREAIRALLTPEVLAHIQNHGKHRKNLASALRAIAALADEAMNIEWDEAVDALAQGTGRSDKDRKP